MGLDANVSQCGVTIHRPGSLFLAWEWRTGPTWCWIYARRDLYVRKMLRTVWVPNLNINTKRRGIPEPISTRSEWESRNWIQHAACQSTLNRQEYSGCFCYYYFSYSLVMVQPCGCLGNSLECCRCSLLQCLCYPSKLLKESESQTAF